MGPLHIRRFTLIVAGITCATCAAAGSVVVEGRAYTNHGLVGVGRIRADQKDSLGETFGSFSAFAFEPGSWKRNPDGTYAGTLVAQPDRGYNRAGTTDYLPRFHRLAVSLRPADSTSAGRKQASLRILETVAFRDGTTPFTSVDPTPVGAAMRAGFPPLPQAFNGRLSLDAEGIAVARDGALWVSDEYGPYTYQFSSEGVLRRAIRPPEAVIPKRRGVDSFSSDNPAAGQPKPQPGNPTTGRANNQGMEGLSLSPDGRTLFGLLQSATRQDGGTSASGPRRHTRLFAWDISGDEPRLTGEWVLRLPVYRDGHENRTAAQSELLAITETQFLVLARDGNGRGGANPVSVFRQVLVYDITKATNIAGTAFDTVGTPVAPDGKLAPGIVPANGVTLVDLNDPEQLAKFGLTNGTADSADNLSEKWEALALVPALDPAATDNWFLFVGNDNDFLTTNGFQAGTSYRADLDVDSMVLVYRLTIASQR